MIRRGLLLVLVLALSTTAFAQNAIPTPDEYLGYTLGARFTPWDRILDYFGELARRSDLITLEKFGETNEGRPLVLAIVTSQKNRARLDAIRSDIASLANGSVDAAHAAAVASSTPAVAWLAFGIHGNESSSAEAAMRIASTLLRDPESSKLLDDLVVVIDPLQNPDGRERYVQWYKRTRGAAPDPNPESFEHAEPWPGGRYNHYLIDMNRDWAWLSQRETQARVEQYRRWNPEVFVDFHEMGPGETYFFPPDAKPINANLPKDVERWLAVFGRANADAFSRRGWPFFVGETFDLFYPAYGDSWPALHGAIGMTYEVAGGGSGGTVYRREDGTNLELAFRIDEHYTSGMATLRTAAAHREDLLRYLYDAARAEIDGGKNTYLIPPGAPNGPALISLLQRQGITVGQLGGALAVRATPIGGAAVESHNFPAGTAVVTTRQPLGRLVETLLETAPTFTPGFIERQRTRAEADEPDEFYDLTSWSLPLAMNVPAWVAPATTVSAGAGAFVAPAPDAFRPASYGYLVDALDPNLYRFAGLLVAEGVNFNVSEDEVTAGDHTFARGTIVILKGNNKADLDATLARNAKSAGVTVAPLESGWSGGTAFGSERIHYVRDPKIALVGGAGVSATSYGMLWHTLDVVTPIPHSNISIDSLRRIDLSHYHVLVLPDSDAYEERLGKKGVEKLQAWVRDGGSIVAIGQASKFLTDKDVEISKLKQWEPPKKKDDDEKNAQDQRYNEYSVPGATFRTTINPHSYLTFGVQRPPFVLIQGSAAYLPVSHKVDNIVTIDATNPLAAGVAWPESLERLKGAVYLVNEPYGRGNVITFADEPNFRSFWRGTLPLFLNAVLYSPSFPR